MERMMKTAKWIDRLCLILALATLISAALAIGGLVLSADGPVEISLASAAVSFGAFLAGIALVRQILRPMKAGRPFSGVVTQNLRRLGVLTLICAALDLGYETFGKTLLAFGGSAGGEVTVVHQWNPLLLIMAALLFLMSYVFRYGEELQQLSDETL